MAKVSITKYETIFITQDNKIVDVLMYLTGMSDSGGDENVVSHPVHLHFINADLTDRRLFDIDGFVLTGRTGNLLNIYTNELNDAFSTRDIRLIHRVTPGYRFFITHPSQYSLFNQVRNNGWRYNNEVLHFYVYDDNDCDYCNHHFKGAILNF